MAAETSNSGTKVLADGVLRTISHFGHVLSIKTANDQQLSIRIETKNIYYVEEAPIFTQVTRNHFKASFFFKCHSYSKLLVYYFFYVF